jgi:hypothetical protein
MPDHASDCTVGTNLEVGTKITADTFAPTPEGSSTAHDGDTTIDEWEVTEVAGDVSQLEVTPRSAELGRIAILLSQRRRRQAQHDGGRCYSSHDDPLPLGFGFDSNRTFLQPIVGLGHERFLIKGGAPPNGGQDGPRSYFTRARRAPGSSD